jgi:hypothetical protein
MNENIGDFIMSTHVPDSIVDPLGETLDASAKSDNPFVQAVLSMLAAAPKQPKTSPNSQVSA